VAVAGTDPRLVGRGVPGVVGSRPFQAMGGETWGHSMRTGFCAEHWETAAVSLDPALEVPSRVPAKDLDCLEEEG
jgi:hypothetical protein